jgi:ABC-type bacteriocin/lantibiotic exporter with double-glycine peptidase domain
MLESLKHNVNLPALFVVLGLVASVGSLGLWAVHRSTGRRIREMLALLAAAFLTICLMIPLVIFFDEWLKSPDLAVHQLAHTLLVLIFLPIALAIWWIFNRLSKQKSQRQSRRKAPANHEPIA